MNIVHIIWILFLLIFFLLAAWVRLGIAWAIPFALSILLAYKAITESWEVFAFPPIVGMFIISFLGFIFTSIKGEFIDRD